MLGDAAPFEARLTCVSPGRCKRTRACPVFAAKVLSGAKAAMSGDGCGTMSLPSGDEIAKGLFEAGGKAGPDAPWGGQFGKGVRVRGDPRDAKTASEHLAP